MWAARKADLLDEIKSQSHTVNYLQEFFFCRHTRPVCFTMTKVRVGTRPRFALLRFNKISQSAGYFLHKLSHN